MYAIRSYYVPLYSYEMMPDNCLIHGNYSINFYAWREELIDSDKNEIYKVIKNTEANTQMLVYAKIIGTKDNLQGFLFLNCSLEPIESTTKIIQKQFYYIAASILLLAFIITLFISNRISKPIVKITKTAKEFAKGNYSVHFSGGAYSEANELSAVLNYAGKEISKVDRLRRELISNISHDLRTPLTIIKAYAA